MARLLALRELWQERAGTDCWRCCPAPALPTQVHREVGDHLLIEEEGCFFPCEVLEVLDFAKGVWLVHYLGWDHIRDEKVGGASSAARILADTPAHRLLCADLEAQIRRIQRKGSQLPRVRNPASALASCRCRLPLHAACRPALGHANAHACVLAGLCGPCGRVMRSWS
jgi:hypothetical protein